MFVIVREDITGFVRYTDFRFENERTAEVHCDSLNNMSDSEGDYWFDIVEES